MRKTKWNVLLLTSALALTFLCAQATAVPRPGGQGQSEQATKKETVQSVNVYRVNYKISEREDGRTINARSYTLMAKTGSRASTHIGNRIPMDVGGKGLQYQDFGMNIDCIVTKQESNLLVETGVGMVTLGGKEPATSSITPPVMRNLTLRDVTSAVIGKPALVGLIDDIASNRRYVIEVTVTKVR